MTAYCGFFGRCIGCAYCDANLSTAAPRRQDRAEAGNKPPTGGAPGGRP